ncbi:hypothetical protein [Nonomuraea endophytica]|uniref:hypothetical protein n=1 Tax=Nonomuraea endophytica TaxID=714136 RepID=UPI0037CA9E3E
MDPRLALVLAIALPLGFLLGVVFGDRKRAMADLKRTADALPVLEALLKSHKRRFFILVVAILLLAWVLLHV